jgi:ATP-dependent RNA helicase CshB
MDIPDVSDVISVDLPLDLEFYYHRAGRTGRFGKDGDSWVFYNADTTERPEELMANGVPFDFYVLKGDTLQKDPVGLAPKKKLSKKKELPAQEVREIKIAKALSREKTVKPMYKKKKQFAIDKVKKKYRRKAIQQSVRLELTKQWKAAAKKKNHQDD